MPEDFSKKNEIKDNYGPWLKPKIVASFCIFCRMEKSEWETKSVLDEMGLDMFENYIHDIKENNTSLPLSICKCCDKKFEEETDKENKVIDELLDCLFDDNDE